MGARVELPVELDPFVALFSESASRALVSVGDESAARFDALCTASGVPCRAIGVTQGTGDESLLDVRDAFEITLGALRATWSATIPRALSR